MNIALIIMIPITLIVFGFFMLKSVQLGLKWGMQAKEGIQPELKPFAPIVEAVQQNKANKINNNQTEVINEWMFGESK